MFRQQNDDADDFKKKRQEYSFTLRKINREELFNKCRNIDQNNGAIQDIGKKENIVDGRYANEIRKLNNENYSIKNLHNYVCMLDSNEVLTQLKGIIGLRKIIDSDSFQSNKENPITSQLIKQGAIEKFVGFINQNSEPRLKFQAIWIISSITFVSGVCAELTKQDIIKSLIMLLQKNQPFTINHAVMSIGNMTADNCRFRDEFLHGGVLQKLYKIMGSAQRKSLYLNCLWVISNLCRGMPPPDYSLIQTAIPVLCRQMKNKIFQQLHIYEIHRVYSDILWNLVFLTQNSKAISDILIENGTIPIILNCTLNSNSQIYFPAIKIIGNLASQGQKQTDALIDIGLLDVANNILYHPKKSMGKQILWILSNIAYGKSNQVEKLLSRIDILDKINQFFHSEDPEIKQEICWIYPNLGYSGKKKKIIQLYLHYDIMSTYVKLLDEENVMLLENILKCIYKILLVGNRGLSDGNNIMLMKFIEYGGVQRLEKLQKHEFNKIYKGVVAILTKFFELENKN